MNSIIARATALTFSTGALVAILPISSAFAACATNHHRAGDDSQFHSAIGVRGKLRIPLASEVSVTTSSGPSAGDVFLYDDNGTGFVQFGWQVGPGTDIPYHTDFKAFWGESTGAQAEELQSGPALEPGTYHNFKIEPGEDANYYSFYLDGNLVGGTTMPHGGVQSAAFTGEVDTECVAMNARAVLPDQPKQTLQYLRVGSGGTVWNYFNDSRYHDAGTQSTIDGDDHTDHAYSTY